MKILSCKQSIIYASLCFLLVCILASSLNAEDDFLSDEELYGDFEDKSMVVSDPLQPLNRTIFKLNDFIYLNVLRHIANGYQTVTPDIVEKGISNFFENLNYPVRLAGNLLQARTKGAWIETERFIVNTTLGIGGVYKAANHFERMQPIEAEDIGQALGSWGIGKGPYLVLPLLGPSNVRELFGLFGDRAVHPLDEPFTVAIDWELELALDTTEFLSRSANIIDRYIRLKESTLDPYSAIKSGYTERRDYMIKN